MELTDYIAALLRQHNCVIVPDFGGFIANYKPAVIDKIRQRVSPPTKSVLFNPKLITNDGLLGNTIVKEQAVSYPDALLFIQNEVAIWEDKLSSGDRVEVGEIGFLYRQNQQIVFEQSREINLLLNAYGLSSISFINFVEKKREKVIQEQLIAEPKEAIPETSVVDESPVIRLHADEIKEIATKEEADTTEETIIPISRKNRTGLKYLAAAAAVPLLFYAYWIPAETDFLDTGKIQVADFNPIHKSQNRKYQLRDNVFNTSSEESWKSWEDLTDNLSDNVKVYNYQFDDELYIPVVLDRAMTEITDVEAISTDQDNKPYHVIAGCFSVKSNAEQLVRDLNDQGYQSQILDFNGGLYRVTAGDYGSRSEAGQELEAFKNKGFSGWILKK